MASHETAGPLYRRAALHPTALDDDDHETHLKELQRLTGEWEKRHGELGAPSREEGKDWQSPAAPAVPRHTRGLSPRRVSKSSLGVMRRIPSPTFVEDENGQQPDSPPAPTRKSSGERRRSRNSLRYLWRIRSDEEMAAEAEASKTNQRAAAAEAASEAAWLAAVRKSASRSAAMEDEAARRELAEGVAEESAREDARRAAERKSATRVAIAEDEATSRERAFATAEDTAREEWEMAAQRKSAYRDIKAASQETAALAQDDLLRDRAREAAERRSRERSSEASAGEAAAIAQAEYAIHTARLAAERAATRRSMASEAEAARKEAVEQSGRDAAYQAAMRSAEARSAAEAGLSDGEGLASAPEQGWIEWAINVAERVTDADLDGDGDIGLPGSHRAAIEEAAAAREAEAAAAEAALRAEAAKARESRAAAPPRTEGWLEWAVNVAERATSTDLDGDGDIGLPGPYYEDSTGAPVEEPPAPAAPASRGAPPPPLLPPPLPLTTLTEQAHPGDTVLHTNSQEGFAAGDVIRIGGVQGETAVITAFGSIHIATPLVGYHPIGSVIMCTGEKASLAPSTPPKPAAKARSKVPGSPIRSSSGPKSPGQASATVRGAAPVLSPVGIEWARGMLANPDRRRALCAKEFAIVDVNSDGSLDRDEVLLTVKRVCDRSGLALPQRKRCEELFALCDESGDGRLQVREFQTFFRTLLESAVQHAERLAASPVGVEWARALLANNGARRSLCAEEFAIVDVNSDGSLDRDEVLLTVKRVCDRSGLALPQRKRCEELFALCDESGDGRLQVREFQTFFRTLLESAVQHADQLAAAAKAAAPSTREAPPTARPISFLPPPASPSTPPRWPELGWSTELRGREIEVRDGGLEAVMGTEGHGHVVISKPLPRTGTHFVEVAYQRSDRSDGASLGSSYATGVITPEAARANVGGGLTDLSYDSAHTRLAHGFWGVDDMCAVWTGPEGKAKLRARHEARTARPADAEYLHCVFLSGDRVGLIVDMDAHTLQVARNGTPIPSLFFTGLPRELHVAACPFNKGSSVRILT